MLKNSTKKFLVYPKDYIESFTAQKYTLSALFNKLESDKSLKLVDTVSNEDIPVTFILSVRTCYTNKIALDDLTSLPYFKLNPNKFIASTLWENCSIITKEFLDVYKNPRVPDYKFYPDTDLVGKWAYLYKSDEITKVFVFCQLVINDELEEAVNLNFVGVEDFKPPLDLAICDLVTSNFKVLKGGNL